MLHSLDLVRGRETRAGSKKVASQRTSWSTPRVRQVCAALFVISSTHVIFESRALADEIERIAVSYEVHPPCPDEDAFVGEIAARTSKFRRVSEHEASRVLRVKLSREPGHAMTRGELVLADGEARVVHDENCAVVVSGLALIAALAIDPEAETGPVDRVAPPPSPPPSPPPPPPPTPLVEPPPPPKMVVAKPRSEVVAGALVGVGARVGLVPVSAVAMIAGVIRLEGPGWLHPQARLQLAGTGARTESVHGPAAKLQWLGGHLEGCELLGRGRFRTGPCALFEVGAVRATGVNVNDAISTTRAGASVGAGMRSILTAGHFYGDIGAFALVPFRRDRFYVDPSVTLFQSSAVGGEVGANVGVNF